MHVLVQETDVVSTTLRDVEQVLKSKTGKHSKSIPIIQ